MRNVLALLLVVPLLAQPCTPERDKYGRILRSKKAVSLFRATVPCPATGVIGHRCAGYVVDHIIPLACCGEDAPSNMQWQTKEDAKSKDKWERKVCGAAD